MSDYTLGPWKVKRVHGDLLEIQGEKLAVATLIGYADKPDVQADARLIAAAPDFFAACESGVYPDVSRLDWLGALLSMYPQPLEDDEDPEASRLAISECRLLLADLRAAVAKVLGQEVAP